MSKWKVMLALVAVAGLAVAVVAVAGVPRFPLTSSSPGGGTGLLDGDDGGDDGGEDDDDDDGKESDFSLFTTEVDDFVTCTSKSTFYIHISVTNFDVDETRLNIIFADADLVTYFVPAGTSFSLVQVAGTNPGVDDVIKVDPQDDDGDVSPMVGWVSVIVAKSGEVGCTVAGL
jgi:hypothetical protein